LRCFIAINLPESVKNILTGLQQELGQCGADIRWVRPENIHLTLKFLGDINKEAVEDIVKILELAGEEHAAFDFEIFGAGVFPNMKSPRVLWVGLKTGELFAALHQMIEKGAASLGFKAEKRRFLPHLTLGRFRSSRGKSNLIEKIRFFEKNSFGSFNIKSVCLMQSTLKPAGAEYTIMKEVFFK
jgi:2'-5' RNA ligase